MIQEKQTFRLFVSSTFNDLKTERNALQERVFPRLREKISKHGHLQVIDLRWGVSEEASLDQQAMNICLKEIERCQQTTPRPNFLVLLGDRYGWRPPLSQIPDDEFKKILKKSAASDKAFLKEWYTLDKNAEPHEWRLNPRNPEGKYKEPAEWQPIESRLFKILSSSAKNANLRERLLHYTSSATEQEIAAGALCIEEAPEHVHCFFRSIDDIEEIPNNFSSQSFLSLLVKRIDEVYQREKLNKPNEELITKLHEMPPGSTAKEFNDQIQAALKQAPKDSIEKDFVEFIQLTLVNFTAREFINLDDTDWTVDKAAYEDQNNLKKRLVSHLPDSNIHLYQAKFTGEGISADHIDQFCEDVYDSLLNVILEQVENPREISSIEKLDIKIKPSKWLDEEGLAHHQFAEERLRFFVGRDGILKNIQSFIKDDYRKTLAIVGEGGTGKSVLLAKAIQQTQRNFSDRQIIYRFIGATPGSSVGRTLLESLCCEISRRYDADETNVPIEYSDLVSELGIRMRLATAKKPLILFLDSLDQLSPTNDARSLTWLPSDLPEHVSVITSTRYEDTFDNLKAKQVHIQVLSGLSREEGSDLLSQWLKKAGRTLQKRQWEEVLDKFEQGQEVLNDFKQLYGEDALEQLELSPGNPLYLKLAFEEARLWTSTSDKPQERLALGVKGIIEKNMFGRLTDTANHGKELVSHALGYLAASRNGLTEDELVDLLSRDYQVYDWFLKKSFHLPADLIQCAVEYRRDLFENDNVRKKATEREKRAAFSWLKEPRTPPEKISSFLIQVLPKANGPRLPIVLWSRLFFDLSAFLNKRSVNGSSLLNFYHRELRDATKASFLDNGQDQIYHERLADYFATRDLDRRKTDELPWQLSQIGSWPKLYDNLADLSFFKACYDADKLEVQAYWAQVEENFSLGLVDAYQPVINDPARNFEHVWRIALLLDGMGYLEEALKLQEYLVQHYRQIDDPTNLQGALINQALILYTLGDLDGAMTLYKEEERISRELGDKQGLLSTLINQANILRDRNNLKEAVSYYKKGERICREIGDRDGLQVSLGNQAIILYSSGDLDEAMALYKEQEGICRELGNRLALQVSLGNQALILEKRGDLDGAMALHKEVEPIYRELGDREGLARSLGNQANILSAHGKFDEAMEKHKEGERISRELGNKEGLQKSLGNQALILVKRGDLDGAMALHKEEECISRELGNWDALSKALSNQGLTLEKRGDLDEAMAMFKEVEHICRELGNRDGLQNSLGNQALTQQKRGRLYSAMAMFKEQERICRDIGNKEGLQKSLNNQAIILEDRGDLDEAMVLYKESEQIYRELGNINMLILSLMNQAMTLGFRLYKIKEALALIDEAYKLAVDSGDVSLAEQIETTRSQLAM